MCVKAEFARDDFADEIAFADEQRHDERARRGNFRQNLFDLRFLFPERLADFGENLPPAQFRRMFKNRRGGIFILRRAVAQHHQRSVGEIVTVHAGKIGAANFKLQVCRHTPVLAETAGRLWMASAGSAPDSIR